MTLKTILSLSVLLLASAPLALAQGTYTQIDVPGSVATECLAANSAGDIAGLYLDSSFNYHGFFLTSGTYTTIDYPGGADTYLYGLNNVGQIVGDAGNSIAFVYDLASQNFTLISRPNATNTFVYSINDSGEIGGTATAGNGQRMGFVMVGSLFHTILPPNTLNSFVSGVTSSGLVVGQVNSPSHMFNFLSYQGQYKHLPITAVSGPIVNGVSSAGGAFVGQYTPSSGVTAGFLYQGKIVTALQFPGSNYTLGFGINPSDEVVGYFEDANGLVHGFTWTPPAAAEKK